MLPFLQYFLCHSSRTKSPFQQIEYPTAFGEEGLVGASAKNDISARKAFLFVPNKMLITNIGIRKSEIGHIFLDNPKIFDDHPDGEYLSLVVFIIYEMLKGRLFLRGL